MRHDEAVELLKDYADKLHHLENGDVDPRDATDYIGETYDKLLAVLTRPVLTPNCPGNIKLRTPAEAEELVDALIEKAASTQHWWERGDWDTFYARLDQRDEARAALIAALTGGGE